MVLFRINYRKLRWNKNLLSLVFYRCVSRAITGDRLSQDTLTGRILSYLNTTIDKKDDIITETAPQFVQNNHISHAILRLNSLRNKNITKNQHELKKSLKVLDKECCQHSTDCSITETLVLLWSFTTAIPHQVSECQYFKLALKQLIQQVNELTKHELIQLIFFIGFLRKSTEAQNMMKRCLHQLDGSMLDNLTREELCIICNSSFQTATRIKNKYILDKIKSFMNGSLDILKDPELFITLIKTIRYNHSQDDDLLETITCTLFFNKTVNYYDFPAICHILALYSDYLYYDEKILQLLAQHGISQLKDYTNNGKCAHLQTQPRITEIKRFLWALSNLNYSLPKDDIENTIVPKTVARMNAGEFKNDPGTLMEILLYLWIMNYKAVDLIKVGLTKENIAYIKANQIPLVDKLNLLLICFYFEERDLFNSMQLYPEQSTCYDMDIQKENRPYLKKILKNLKEINLQSSVRKYELSCQVPCINIIGIIGLDGKNNRVVNIEVLDSYTLTKNNLENTTGLMALKLRILDKYDEGLIVIDARDLDDLNDHEVQDLLIEDLALVC